MRITLEHTLEVDKILLLFLRLLLRLFLLIVQKVEHLIVRVLNHVRFEVHNGLVLGQRTHLLDQVVALLGQDLQDAESGLGDVVLLDLWELVDPGQTLEPDVFAPP